MANIIFINSSPNRNGNTAKLAATLLKGTEYETIDLCDYVIGGYGQHLPGDQYAEVLERIREADTVVLGSPVYWHNLSGLLRCFIDRAYDVVERGEFTGRDLYAVVQGAAPEKWMLEACDYTLGRFAGIYGFAYKGMVTSIAEAKKAKI